MQCNLCRNALGLMEEISGSGRLRLKPIYDALYEAAMTDVCAGLADEYDPRTGTAAIQERAHDSIHQILLDNIDTVFALAAIEGAKRHKGGKEDVEQLASLVRSVARAVASERGQ